jgi:hypothetical protein
MTAPKGPSLPDFFAENRVTQDKPSFIEGLAQQEDGRRTLLFPRDGESSPNGARIDRGAHPCVAPGR